MEMEPMNEKEPDQKYDDLGELITIVNKAIDELRKVELDNKAFHPKEIQDLHEAIGNLSKKSYITLGPGGAACSACGGTGRA